MMRHSGMEDHPHSTAWDLRWSASVHPAHPRPPPMPMLFKSASSESPTTLSGSFFLTILKRVLGAVYTWRLHTLHAVLPMNVEHQFVFANDMPYGHMQTRPALVLKKVPCSGCPLSVQFGIEGVHYSSVVRSSERSGPDGVNWTRLAISSSSGGYKKLRLSSWTYSSPPSRNRSLLQSHLDQHLPPSSNFRIH